MRQNSIPAQVRRVQVPQAQRNARLRPQKRLLSMLLLLLTCVAASIICANVLTPQPASASDEQGYGNDGYFSALKAAKIDGSKVLPVLDADSATVPQGDGWANTRRILFGKQGNQQTYNNYSLQSGYKTLGFGDIPSKIADNAVGSGGQSKKTYTTGIQSNEALLFSEAVVAEGVKFDTTTNKKNTFEYQLAGYQSNLATVLDAPNSTADIAGMNYSPFEQDVMTATELKGVCVADNTEGCSYGGNWTYTEHRTTNAYKVFPLSYGDLNVYFGTDSSNKNDNLALSTGEKSRSYWLRSPDMNGGQAGYVNYQYLIPSEITVDNSDEAVRPAFLLNVSNLLLAAESTDQSQLPLAVTDADKDKSLRLTFADEGELVTRLKFDSVTVAEGSDVQVQARGTIAVSGSSTFDADADGWGWKIIDPAATDGSVLASGLTSGDGNITIPDSLVAWHDYELYVWAQENGSAEEGWSNRATEPVKITLEAVDTTVDLGADGYFSTLTSDSQNISAGDYATTRRIVFGKQSSNGTYTGRTLTAGYKVLAVGAITSSAQNPFASGNSTSSNTTLLGSKEALLFSQDTVTSAFRFTGDQNSAVFDSVIGEYSSSLAATSKQVGKQNYAPFEQKLLRSRPVEGVCGSTAASCESGSQPTDNTSAFSYLTFPLSGGDLRNSMGHSSGASADTNLANNASYWLRSSKWDTTKNALYVNSEGGVQSTHAINAEAGLRPAFRLKLNRLVLAANNTDQSQTAGDTRLTFADMNATLSNVKVNGSTDLNAKITVEQGQSLKVEGSSTLAAADGWGWKIINTEQSSVVVESGYAPGVDATDITIPTTVRSGDTYELWLWQQHTGNASEGLSNQGTVPVKVNLRVLSLYGPDGYFSELVDGYKPVKTDGRANNRNILFGKTKNQTSYSNTTVWDNDNVTEVGGKSKTIGVGPVTSVKQSGWSTSLLANEVLLFSNSSVSTAIKFNDDKPSTNRFDWSDGYQSMVSKVSSGVASTNYSDIELASLRDDTVEGVCKVITGCNSTSPQRNAESSMSHQSYRVFPISATDIPTYFGGTLTSGDQDGLACESVGACGNSTQTYFTRSPFGGVQDKNIIYVVGSKGSVYGTNGNHGLRVATRLSLKNLILTAESTSQAQRDTGDLRLTLTQPNALLTLTKLTATKNSDAIDLSLEGTSTGITQSGLGWKLVDPLTNKVKASGRTNSDVSTDGNMTIPSTVAAGDYDLYVWGQQDGSAEQGWSNTATKPLRTTLTIPDSSSSDEPTTQHPELPDYELIIPSGFVLDGTHRGEDSNWVGESDNVQIVVNTLESDSHLDVSVNAESDDNTFALTNESGTATSTFKVRQNDASHTNSALSSGDSIFDIGSTGTFNTSLQVNWDDDGNKVPINLKAGKYQGKLLFSVTEVN